MISNQSVYFLVLYLSWFGLQQTTEASSDKSFLRRFFYKFADDDDSEKAEPFDVSILNISYE